ncbi:DUF488 family protein [Plantactinospora sp. BB1]|uniref:DUF488 domain-containing protein n=1 Tax=Plantactinospora sp. BB1 TaxID=2071627 RepID=UPI000D155AF1|nr:DUF488 domain-containing protein [Plantactinospora sp. BB1]AVT37743.1 DNA repair protein [Plantactinospora sp. BB1]
MTHPLITVGHGTLSQQEFAALLKTAGIVELVDVRRFPGSRRHPHFSREALTDWLPAAGIRYRWEERLGGRRRLPPESPDVWWQVDAFRAYAAHMRTPEFQDAMTTLTTQLEVSRLAVMCSESVWWRCHRRLIADFAAKVCEIPVRHLAHNGRLTEHAVAPGARLSTTGSLVYDLA